MTPKDLEEIETYSFDYNAGPLRLSDIMKLIDEIRLLRSKVEELKDINWQLQMELDSTYRLLNE